MASNQRAGAAMMPSPCLGCSNRREIPAPEGPARAPGHGASHPLPHLSPSSRGLCWGPSTSHLLYPCSPPAIAAHRALPDSARFRHRSRSVDADGSSQPCFLRVLNPRHEHCRLPGSPAPRQPSGHLNGGGLFPQSQVQPSPSVTRATGRDSLWEGGEPWPGM